MVIIVGLYCSKFILGYIFGSMQTTSNINDTIILKITDNVKVGVAITYKEENTLLSIE